MAPTLHHCLRKDKRRTGFNPATLFAVGVTQTWFSHLKKKNVDNIFCYDSAN